MADAAESNLRPSWVAQVAAWVAIVAGVVFTVAVVFFSGVALGRHSTEYGWHGDGWSGGQMGPGGTGGCSMMESGGMQMHPGGMGPMRPMNPSASPTPTRANPPRPLGIVKQ